MGNILGKAIIEGKKIVDTVVETVTPVVSESVKTVKEQSSVLTSQAKRYLKISTLEAEIDNLYKDFGKATFEWGLMPSNEKAMELMKVLYSKTEELDKLKAEADAEKAAREKMTSEDNYDFGESGEETPIVNEPSVELKKEDEVEEEIKADEVEKEVKKPVTKKRTSTKKTTTKKSDSSKEPKEDN